MFPYTTGMSTTDDTQWDVLESMGSADLVADVRILHEAGLLTGRDVAEVVRLRVQAEEVAEVERLRDDSVISLDAAEVDADWIRIVGAFRAMALEPPVAHELGLVLHRHACGAGWYPGDSEYDDYLRRAVGAVERERRDCGA